MKAITVKQLKEKLEKIPDDYIVSRDSEVIIIDMEFKRIYL